MATLGFHSLFVFIFCWNHRILSDYYSFKMVSTRPVVRTLLYRRIMVVTIVQLGELAVKKLKDRLALVEK